MAEQFDNSIAVFTRPTPSYALFAAGVFVLVCLLAGLLTSLAVESWSMALLFLLSIGGTAAQFSLSYSYARRLKATRESKAIDWNTALPEVQRQTLNVEVVELSKLLEVGTDQMSDLQSAYIVAEDLALRQIQHEERAPLIRHVSVGGVPFDAVLAHNDLIVCIEVVFLVAPDLRQERIDAVMRKAALAKKTVESIRPETETRLMLVLITQLVPEDLDALRSRLKTDRFSPTTVDIDIRFLDFEALQHIYIAT